MNHIDSDAKKLSEDAKSLWNAGNHDDAIGLRLQILKREPSRLSSWALLAQMLSQLRSVKITPELEQFIAIGLAHPAIEPASIAGVASALLVSMPAIKQALAQLRAGRLLTVAELVELTRPLLLRLFTTGIVTDPELADLVCGLRRSLLLAYELHDAQLLPLGAAVAIQVTLQEFLCPADAAEQARSAAIDIASGPLALLVRASYFPLGIEAEALSLEEPLKSVFRLQTSWALEERGIEPTIPRLTNVDVSSIQVQEQYEANPYPRWVRCVAQAERQSMLDYIRDVAQTNIAAAEGEQNPDILIAGCGTGRQAIQTAVCFKHNRILAVDLSRSSLAFAVRQARTHGIQSIFFAQADLLSLPGLPLSFDIVQCAGVLHHLNQPDAGWYALASLLKPGGYMLLALYSMRARAALRRIRLWAREQGYSAQRDSLQAFHAYVMAHRDDPLLEPLMTYTDFYSISGLRDLLFHVCEHETSIKEIRKTIADFGLEFVCFATPQVVNAAYRRRFPNERIDSLDNWDLFEQENPATFSEMYQFWVRKPIAPAPGQSDRAHS